MKKIIAIALAIVMVLTLGTSALAAAQKLDLRENPPRCDVPAAGEPVAGFVVLNNDNETDEVVVVVSLKEGAPNTTYMIVLEDYNSLSKWQAYKVLGYLTTNSQGKGNFDTRVSRSPSDYYLQIVVSLGGAWGSGSFGTDIATITIK